LIAALGAFDGLHKGHWKVLNYAGRNAGVIFFEPLPRQYFGGNKWHKRLTTPAERYELLQANGICSIITLPFDSLTAGTLPKDFCKLLVDIDLFSGFVVGYDFRFGIGASGTIDELRKNLSTYGLTVTEVSSEDIEGVPVKSEMIRQLLLDGKLGKVSDLLGRAYDATGVVSRGKGIGRTLGFPTLNVRVPEAKLLPPAGSYASFARIGCTKYKAVAFVIPSRNLIEVHVSGLEEDLYGHKVSVEFISFIREPSVYNENRMLIKAIKNDLDRSMEVLREC